MAFYRCKMEGGIYPFIIAEGENCHEALEISESLPGVFGETDEEDFLEEIDAPLAEPWPIFTKACYDMMFEE